ncbi:MAG: hypothetical protein U1E62_10965 [Alsobacter sp.]
MAQSGRPATITSVDFGLKSSVPSAADEALAATRNIAETAHYVAQLSGELAGMARTAKLDVLAYFLEMAKVEAETARRTGTRS